VATTVAAEASGTDAAGVTPSPPPAAPLAFAATGVALGDEVNANGSTRTSTHTPAIGPNLIQKYDLGRGIVRDLTYRRRVVAIAPPMT
jgi:hypothetical protein